MDALNCQIGTMSRTIHIRTPYTSDGRAHGGLVSARRTSFQSVKITGKVDVLLLLESLPTWPSSSRWGFYPSGGLGLVLLILIILVLAGRI